MVTHDVGEALLLADEVVVMAGGQVLAHAPPGRPARGPSGPDVVADLDRRAPQAGRAPRGAGPWLIMTASHRRPRLLPERLGWHVTLSAVRPGPGPGHRPAAGRRRRPQSAPEVDRRWRLRRPGPDHPSLALLALFYPLLLLLSGLARRCWATASGPGLPAVAAGPDPLFDAADPAERAAGVSGVDPAVVEAARGVGMTDRQRLWQVELPLAAPVIMAGVRTAAVWTIGAATLSTPVGQTSLGDYIFSGLQTEDWVAVLVGCAASAGLAMIVDGLLGLIETGARDATPSGCWIGGVGLPGLLAA
jgi:osmoprotectant transport system permease protein